jgi:DNA-binding NtrC family response regulator
MDSGPQTDPEIEQAVAALPVLVVDDDPDVRTYLTRTIARYGLESMQAEDLGTAMELLTERAFSILFVDKYLPDGDGVNFCRNLPPEPCGFGAVIITGAGEAEEAMTAIGGSIKAYIPKPVSIERIRYYLAQAVPHDPEDFAEGVLFEPRGAEAIGASDREKGKLVARSAVMIDLAGEMYKLAKMNNVVVNISGPTGSGKEIVARRIHELSPRRDGKFVALNCGAVSAELIESELFGHEKGSFTGAVGARAGLFQEAQGGTIFLDEISETSLGFQVKLLRVLQESTIRRVGANSEIPVDVRVITATNRNLKEEITAGRFREDLYFRLKGSELVLPPLKDREGDIIYLAEFFAQRAVDRIGRGVAFSKGARQALQSYSWPGNVRELGRVVELVVQRCGGTILRSDLPKEVQVAFKESSGERAELRGLLTLEEMEDQHIDRVLQAVGGSQVRACEILNVDRKYIARRRVRAAGGRPQ